MTHPIRQYKHPFLFFFLATLVPWLFWFAAGHVSHLSPEKPHHALQVSLLGFIGLLSPVIIALWLAGRENNLDDILGRLISLKSIRPGYLCFALFFMLTSILCAQAVSLLFGHGIEQFRIPGHFTFTSGVFPVWALLIIAPLIEELAWHSYGTDSLRNRLNLFNTSMLFELFWGIWHIPLSFIDGYYHSNVVETSWIHGANFLVSIFPFVLIMNWLYYKTDRSIMVTVIFHITAGLFNEIFATHPDSKVIQTGLLIIFSAGLVLLDRDFFFKRDNLSNGSTAR